MIKIRPPTQQDCDLFINAMDSSKDYHAPWTTVPTTQEQFNEYLLKYNRDSNKSFLVIFGNDLAGVVNLNEIIYGCFKSAYLGYYGVKQFAGMGIMQEGLRLVIEHAFNEFGLHRLEANIQPENMKSINLVKRLGFLKEGFSPKYLYINNQWCDHERWAITAENWLAVGTDEIDFINLSEDHLDLIYRWFKDPIVNKWYARGINWTKEEIQEKYKPRKSDVSIRFIIQKNEIPIGYIQYYLLTKSLPDGIVDYNNKLFNEYKPEELSGIDFFLCDEYQHQGLGVKVIKKFIDTIIPKNCKFVLADPVTNNASAIRTLGKVGFELYEQITDESRKENIHLMIKEL